MDDLAVNPTTLSRPLLHLECIGRKANARALGDWTLADPGAVEREADKLSLVTGSEEVTIDLTGAERLDTLGAWVIVRTIRELESKEIKVRLVGVQGRHRALLEEVQQHDARRPLQLRSSATVRFLVDVGRTVVGSANDSLAVLRMLGSAISACFRIGVHPTRFRGTAFLNQLDRAAVRSTGIIALISFLVGGIMAQQGVFQLHRFGADYFVVDLVGILTLREMGLLLAAIMIAGRSGSAITAEIGSMKMREEIDALRVMGLDPVEVLIVPRLLALVIGLPVLTFAADLSALLGGGLVAWLYGGITPDAFQARLHEAIDLSTVAVGLIKAPFMALVIGLIAAVEGFAVAGSAESLGRHVTSSVVKSIFMVIVLDGVFAMFFAAIEF